MEPATIRDREGLAGFLRGVLFEDILPFWSRHGQDEGGGINTCIGDDGSLFSRDKWLWSQWRAVWVYARLFNRHGGRGEWLERAMEVYRFATRHGWDGAEEGWVLRVDSDGGVINGCESIYVDGFAMYGLAELYRGTTDPEVRDWLIRTADSVARRLDHPHERIPHFPYPVQPGSRMHGIPMLFSLNFRVAGEALEAERFLDLSRRLSEEILRDFYRPERNLILERMGAGGSELPAPAGTAVVPGHVIEDMWFQIVLDLGVGRRDRLEFWCRQMIRHLELGWDMDHGGGILLAVDADGRAEVGWDFADSKLWWPHTEALYALLLGYELTGLAEYADWYDRVLAWSLDHFPVPEHGEWRQRLKRDGQPMETVVALPVKDPFHLPRSLMLQLELLEGRVTT